MITKYANLKKSKLLKAKHTYARIQYFFNAHSTDKQEYLNTQKKPKLKNIQIPHFPNATKNAQLLKY